MKKALILLFLFFSTSLLFAQSKDPIQFVKENRIKWYDENDIDELVQACELTTQDDFIYIEEAATNFSLGIVLLNKKSFYYFDNTKIIEKKLTDTVINELSSMKFSNTRETGQPARDKSYYNIFIKSGETITYVLFDNSSISNTLDDDIKEKDRQTAVKLLDLIGIGIYTFLWEDV